MKIKIIEVWRTNPYTYGDDDVDFERRPDIFSATEWDEVSEKDFEILQQWAVRKSNDYRAQTRPVIISQASIDIPKTIQVYLEEVRAEQEKIDKKKEADAERRRKAAANSEKKDLEKKRKMLEKLKKELGE